MTFDDGRVAAHAGLLLTSTVADRLGLLALFDERVTVAGSAGANPGRKCLSVVASALAGGDCLDDIDGLRAGSTAVVLGHQVAAASTVGTFLRSMNHGHAGQVEAAAGTALVRAADAGLLPVRAVAGPDGRRAPVVVDIDATLIPTFGLAKQGAMEVMRTGRRGYHPMLAVLAGTGEVLATRLRRGRSNDATGAPAFIRHTLRRVAATGPTGPVVVRCDSGFYLAEVLTACVAAGAGFSLGARQLGRMRTVIAGLDETAWTPVPYFEPGAAVAELGWNVFGDPRCRDPRYQGSWVRLIVRRTPTPPGLRDPAQHALFPSYEYHPFITDQPGDPVELDRFHREHAEVELAIRDLKHGLGLNHLPSKSFAANSAWLALQALAHNLARWTARAGGLADTPRQTIKTLRHRYLTVPGRLVHHARGHRLRLPADWPWAQRWHTALTRVRALPARGS